MRRIVKMVWAPGYPLLDRRMAERYRYRILLMEDSCCPISMIAVLHRGSFRESDPKRGVAPRASVLPTPCRARNAALLVAGKSICTAFPPPFRVRGNLLAGGGAYPLLTQTPPPLFG